MSRFSRINTVWRKELADTLRDRRTVIAMVLVPMVLYPALMLGSLQAFELQATRLKQESYRVAVGSEAVQRWLRAAITTDPQRAENQPAVEIALPPSPSSAPSDGGGESSRAVESARTDVRNRPPPYEVFVVPDVVRAVKDGSCHTGLLVDGSPPGPDSRGSMFVHLISDDTEVRSQIASAGLEGVLQRANAQLVAQRLKRFNLDPAFVRPIALSSESIATPEKLGGSILGQIVPLILIIMTITGAIYPAIDLTAGERERGTLETLMVAPVPTIDLITGKFIVVTLIGMLSAVLNLLSIGGTIWLGGMGALLARGEAVVFPLRALPWILVLLIPLAVMFSAMLLAVCSFARSFKEAQNYIVPVMMAALIPAVVGVLPGTRLEGPILIMPVANIVVLTRELFMGRFDLQAILWVSLSTSLYAAAAVAVAAKLFGQEAVLFSDNASIKTILLRKFLSPQRVPTAAQALLVMGLVYPAMYYAQLALLETEGIARTPKFLLALGALMIVLFVLVPWFACWYTKTDLHTTLALARPPLAVVLAAILFGCSTWLLARAWFPIQARLLPMDPTVLAELERATAWLLGLHPALILIFMAAVPAVCEEVFFRGFVLSGLRGGLSRIGAILIVAAAFGLFHQSVHRFAVTFGLGVVLGVIVVAGRSIWPAILMHLMHNGLILAGEVIAPLRNRLAGYGVTAGTMTAPPASWVIFAAGLTIIGMFLCYVAHRQNTRADRARSARPIETPDPAASLVS